MASFAKTVKSIYIWMWWPSIVISQPFCFEASMLFFSQMLLKLSAQIQQRVRLSWNQFSCLLASVTLTKVLNEKWPIFVGSLQSECFKGLQQQNFGVKKTTMLFDPPPPSGELNNAWISPNKSSRQREMENKIISIIKGLV